MPRPSPPRPTPRGVGALVAGAALVLAGWAYVLPVLLFVGATLVALVVVSGLVLVLRRVDVDVRRRWSPARGVAGRPVLESLSLTTPRRSAGTLVVAEQLPWTAEAAPAGVVHLAAGGEATIRLGLDDPPRGRHRVGPLRVDVVDGFGLARRRALVGAAAELVVVPEVERVPGAGRSSLGEGTLRRHEHQATGGEDDPVTREYRRGDPLRRVHWRATARQGDLMVRQEEQHSPPVVRVALSTASGDWADVRPSGTGPATSESFEWAVSAVATLGVHLAATGSTVQVGDLDGRALAMHDGGADEAFLEALADVQLDGAAGPVLPPISPVGALVLVASSLTGRDLATVARLRTGQVRGAALVVSPALAFTTPGAAGGTDPVAPPTVAAGLRAEGWRVHEATTGDDRVAALLEAGAWRARA